MEDFEWPESWSAATARDGAELHFCTAGSSKRPAIFLGPHFYASNCAGRSPATAAWTTLLTREYFVIRADYPRGIGLTSAHCDERSTAELACDDYLRIAKAAGVSKFGWMGFSFGGALGIQLAARTNSVTALVVGGFSPLLAPYQELLSILQEIRSGVSPNHAEIYDAAIGFYESLAEWPERREVGRLTIPRLVYIGDRDTAQGMPGQKSLPLAERVLASERQLLEWGWDVVWLDGHDHVTAQTTEVAGSAVLEFFKKTLH